MFFTCICSISSTVFLHEVSSHSKCTVLLMNSTIFPMVLPLTLDLLMSDGGEHRVLGQHNSSSNAQTLFPTPINYSASLRALPQLGGAVGASGCVPPRGINLEAAGFLEGWMMVGIWFCINPLKLFYIFGECLFRGSKSFEDSEGET